MSHPPYNPYASGDQSSTQRQYELSSISAERDPRRAASHLGPGSSFSSSGASSSIPDNSRGMLPSLLSQSTSYKPEQSRAIMDEDIERSIDMHISRAREGVRLLSKTMTQPVDQGTRFTTTQRNEFRSSGTGMASFPVSSTSVSQGRRHLDEESGSSSVDWSSNYKRTTPDYSSSSSNCASGGDGRFNAPTERDHEMRSIPGLSDYDSTVPDRPASSTESSRPKYTFESAANILLHFGLEKDDLEQLISYPEDQITPANLPFILRQIRLHKTKRATTEVKPNPHPEPQLTRNLGGMDSHNLSTSGGAGMCQKAMSSAVLPSKVIDYGHTGKYTGGTGDEIGRTSGSRADSGGSGGMLLMDTHDSSRHSRELLQKNTTEVKSSAFGSSREQTSSVASLSSSYSSVLNTVASSTHDQTKRLQTQPILSSFSLPKKDTDFRILKSEASKPVHLKEPEADRQSMFKTQSPGTVFRGVHPSRPGLVLIGSNDNSGTRDDSKTRGQGSAVAEQMKKQQSVQQSQQTQKQAVSQTGQAMWPPAFSAAKPLPPAPFIPSVADASRAMQQPVFIPGDPRPIVIPPALPQPIPAPMTFNHMTLPTSNRQPPATVAVSKGLPTAAMMHDYAAASPKIFPHTCSLCNKECTHMKDWLSHQNTSLHLQSCKVLRARYPEWDGEIALRPSAAGQDAKSSASTSAQTSQHHHQKTRHGSYSSSRSDSPGHRHSSEGRREKRSSRSRSPHSSRYTRRSRSRSRSPWYDHTTSCHYRSRSGSPDRRLSPRRRDERRSPPRRREERQLPPRRGGERRSPPRRNDERRSPPRRGDERRSPPRRNDERRSPPRRVNERRSPPRRNDERRSPPRRVDERRSPPRRVGERRSPPRRSDERQSPPRRSDERQSPPRRSDKRRSPLRRSLESRLSSEGSSLPRKSSNAEKLAKKLLQTSVIQSLSKQSDLDAVVKTLAPALLAELAKMKSSSSKPSSSSPSAEAKRLSATVSPSSSSCRAKKMGLTTKLSKGKPILQKSVASSSTTKKSGKPSPPTMVRLEGIQSCLSHNDVTVAVEHFGKTKSVVLFRTKLQAIVCFEKEEDAQKLKSMKSLDVKGIEIRVVGGKETVSKEQKKPPEKKSAISSVSTTTRKVLLPTPNTPPLKYLLPSRGKKATTGKLTSQKVAAKGSVKGLTTVAKSKVLVSKVKSLSTKQVAKTVKTGKLPAKGTVKKVVVKKKLSSGSKSTAPENQPESVVVLKETAEGDESSNRSVPEPAEGREIVTEAKVLVSKAEMVSSTQEPQTPVDKLAAEGAVEKEKVEQPPVKATIVPDVETSSPEESETKVQEAVVVLKETSEDVEAANVTVSEAQHQAELAEDAEPMELGEAGGEVAEPMEDGSCAEGEGEKPTTTEAVAENSADKPNESGPPTSTVETGPTEASIKASPQVQQSTLSDPESTAPGPETKTEAPHMQQQAAVEAELPGGGVETKLPGGGVEAELPGGGVEARTMQEDAEGAVKTQTHAASTKGSSVTTKPTAAAVSKQQPAASTPSTPSTPSPTAVTGLTVGEMVEKHLHRDRITCLNMKTCFSPKFFRLDKKLLLITGLPKYYDGCYTEDDIVKLLTPFGFEYTDDSIYVVPQTCMAFVMMPSVGNVHEIIKVGMRTGIFFKGSKLLFNVVANGIAMTPLGFYKSLMKLMKSPVLDHGMRTIFIKNISQSELRDLREALKKIGSVKNCLPLLDKVFIEFESVRDADRLGVWYGLLKNPPGCDVHRLKIPVGISTSPLPKLPECTLPNRKDVVAGATIPPVEFGVPHGSISPFWVTIRTSPFLFPTVSPWFIIPNYLTVRVKGDIEEASRHGSMFSTIMLTGLPEGNYEHEDVAKLVWRYFPKWDFHSLFYSVVVLPLQRRAFVFFTNWTSCCKFVRDHIKHPFSVRGSKLCVHFVLQDMNPGSSEETMYKSLMKWSNAGVPESKSLEERLLCVEISEASVDVVGVVMEAVASIAAFVGFLPLTNRICVEMVNSSGVKQVLEKCKTFCRSSFKKHAVWSKVKRFETLKSLKRRLQGREITTKSKAQPPPSELSDKGSQPGLQTSDPGGSTMSEPVTAGPSAAASSDVSMEVDGEKSGTEVVMDSTVGPEANEAVEKVEAKGEEGSLTTFFTSAVNSRNAVPAASSPAPSATALMHKEDFAELPPINTEIFKVLTAAVRHHRLSRASRSHSETESPSKNSASSRTVTSEDTSQRMGQDGFTDDAVSSDTCLLDEQNFSMEDFVTVDEVGEDVKDTSLKPYSSSSSSSRVRRERQSSGVSSGSRQTSTRSSKDSRSTASSSSSSSKLTKSSSSSSSSSVSPKKSTDSSEPTKLPTKPSSSAKPSSSSSPPSTVTASLPGQKTLESKTKSPSEASSTTSSGRSTLSSSTTRERDKITSAATVEASIETHLQPLGEEAKASEGAVVKSDHKVSAEGIAAKTVQSGTIMGTEMPPQGHGEELSQDQSQEIDFTVNTLKDQKERKEEGKEEDVDKHTEEDDGESYQILDSLDDQTDEQMEGSSETQRTGPEEGQTLHEESYQDLDGADNKGNPHPEYSEMEMDGSFQVLDSVTEDQEASSQEDSCMVHVDSSTAKQVSEEDAIPVDDKSDAKFVIKDAVDKDQETNKDHFQVLDTGSKQAPRVKGDGKKKNQKEEEVKGKMHSGESSKAFKDVEDPDGQVPNEDPPHQNRDNKYDLKDLDSEITEPDQERFEILDSIDDQAAKEDDSQKLETPSDKISEEHIGPIEEEEDMYQIIDSLEDQPTTTSETDKDKVTEGPSSFLAKRSGATTTASKSEEKEKSPKKDRTVKRYETRKKMDTTVGVFKKDKDTEEATEEMVYKIVDSVEDELVQDSTTTERSGRRRSARGKKEDKITLNLTEASQKPVVDEEAVYEILDSVEDETVDDEPTVLTKSTRGKRERASKKDALIEKTKKENMPTRRRPTPARESQEGNREKTPKKEEKAPSKHSTPTKKSDIVVSEEDATNETFDSVEDKVVKDDRPTPARKRGRPKKEVKTTKKDHGTLKKDDKEASETVADEEEVTYQILDSVDDEMVDDQPPTGQSESSGRENVSKNYDKQTENCASLSGSTKNEEEEEEPMYQIVDSLEDDQDELTSTEVSDRGRTEKRSETPTKEEASAEKGGTPTRGTTVVEESEKMIVQEESLYQIVEDLEEAPDDPSAAEESGTRNKDRTSQTDVEKEDKSTTKSQRETVTMEEEKKQKSPEKNDPTSTLVKLDEVSEEEEDYPDDAAEEEELRKRQAATKKKQFAKEHEARRIREGEGRKQRSWSSSRGGDRGGMRKAKERGRENEEKVEVDTSELVTLDEVGADEAREEGAQESQEWDGEMTEGELQMLVTLDEFVEEEEEDGKAEGGAQETRPLSQEDESVDSFNPETLVTLDEAAGEEEEKPDEEQAEKTSRSAKRKQDDDTEESMNFVTVDEVGEEEEEEKEVVTTRTRGRARKRARPTPVRKSTRGRKVSTKDETEEEPADVLPPSSLGASSSLDKDPSMLSSDGRPEIQETEAEAASQADVDAASAGQELQTLERCVEEGEEEKEAWSRMDTKAASKLRRELVGPEAKRSRSQSPCVAADFTLPPFKPITPLGHCSSQRPNDNLQPSKSVKRKQRCKQQNTRRNGSGTTPEVLQGEEKTGGMQPARPPSVVGKGKAGSFNAVETMMDNMGLTPDQKSVIKPGHDDDLEAEVTRYRKDSDLESSQDLQSPPPEWGRIQLFDDRGEKLQDGELADPNNWSKIAIVRPGKVPSHSPFRHMSFRQATEMKSQSRMVSCFAVETPAKPGDCSDVRATLYDHCQGPWAEIEELVQGKMPRLVAYLVAQPAQALISPRKGYYYNHLTTKSINKTAKNVREGDEGGERMTL